MGCEPSDEHRYKEEWLISIVTHAKTFLMDPEPHLDGFVPWNSWGEEHTRCFDGDRLWLLDNFVNVMHMQRICTWTELLDFNTNDIIRDHSKGRTDVIVVKQSVLMNIEFDHPGDPPMYFMDPGRSTIRAYM